MDASTIQAAVGCSDANTALYGDSIIEAMQKYGIGTTQRQAMFLAQVGHESGSFRYSSEIWGPTSAQARYDGRSDLGNTHPGDGFKYRGRGLIELTGLKNYQLCTTALGVDFVSHPDLLALPHYASMSAAWFWASHGLNEVADTGDFEKTTRIINGGLNGQDDRIARLQIAQQALQGL